MGSIDRIVRIAVAVLIVVLYVSGQLSGIIAVVLLVLAGIFVATSFMSFCPLYLPFGISTIKKEEKS